MIFTAWDSLCTWKPGFWQIYCSQPSKIEIFYATKENKQNISGRSEEIGSEVVNEKGNSWKAVCMSEKSEIDTIFFSKMIQ